MIQWIHNNYAILVITGVMLFSNFVSALPEPGTPFTWYEVFYHFLNGVAQNITKGKK